MAAINIHDPRVNNRAIPGQPILFAILSAIACLVVIVRLYTRFWLKQAPGWDDYSITPALVPQPIWVRYGAVQKFFCANCQLT